MPTDRPVVERRVRSAESVVAVMSITEGVAGMYESPRNCRSSLTGLFLNRLDSATLVELASTEPDPMDFLDAINLLDHLPANFYDDLVRSSIGAG